MSHDDPALASHETVIEPRHSLARLGIPEVWEYRHLLGYFVQRALRSRYRPTRLGYLWILVRPMLLCLAYVLVVGFLFKVDAQHVPFPLFVFLGVALFLFFAGGVSDTASSLINNAGIMSKVYYPRLIVPLTTLVTNFIDLAAALVIVAAMLIYYRMPLPWTTVFAPLYLLGLAGATFALGLICAARTVQMRDILLALPSLMRVVIYTMPCVYPLSLIPERFRDLYFLNPLAVYVQGLRWSMFQDIAPPTWSIVLSTFVVVAALLYGLHYFNRVERAMVDTL